MVLEFEGFFFQGGECRLSFCNITQDFISTSEDVGIFMLAINQQSVV